jgi:hypothetical protein
MPVETPCGVIWAETDGMEASERLELLARKREAFKDFGKTAEALRGNAEILLDLMRDLAHQEVEVAFGIKVGAEAGIPFFGLAKLVGKPATQSNSNEKLRRRLPTDQLESSAARFGRIDGLCRCSSQVFSDNCTSASGLLLRYWRRD